MTRAERYRKAMQDAVCTCTCPECGHVGPWYGECESCGHDPRNPTPTCRHCDAPHPTNPCRYCRMGPNDPMRSPGVYE